jgi:hypothetical protein
VQCFDQVLATAPDEEHRRLGAAWCVMENPEPLWSDIRLLPRTLHSATLRLRSVSRNISGRQPPPAHLILALTDEAAHAVALHVED